MDLEELHKIIQGCSRNDRSCQEKLYKLYYVPLFCLCRRFFRNDHEAIESVNDGMMKVFSSMDSYRPDKGKFFNWVYTIVRNTALDKFRSAVSIPSRPDLNGLADTVPDTDNRGNPILAMEEKDIFILLDELSSATRVVCNLFYIEGYSIKDISEQLKISAGTVKWHLSESRRKLRSIFERHFNERS
jgi:RNA polymerase sigma-70 factor (ECF subfamily)